MIQITRRKRFGNMLRRLFPERQLHIRTGGHVTYLKLSKNTQITCLALFLAFAGWTTFSTVNLMLHSKIITSKDDQIANARLAYMSLLKEVSGYQKKFTSISKDLEENHGLMLSLVEKNTSLQQNLKTVNSKLFSTESERGKIVATSDNLRKQLVSVKDNLQSLTSKNVALEENLGSIDDDLQLALSERNQALFKNNHMRRNISELETRLSTVQETERESVQRLTNGVANFIDTMQRVVKFTGLNVDKLLASGGLVGEGGPFIAAKPDALPGGQIKSDLMVLDGNLQRSEALQEVMRKLPLSPPLVSYRVTSSYGKRRDPVNKRWASHYGMDLGAYLKSPVYATAPGVVTYAGWKGNYGKLIEIDHGAGLKTRYGHLSKILVKKGQKIKFRDKIALLGSTGRSTGPHLHYEINFRGKTRNPAKFIKAGRYVFQE